MSGTLSFYILRRNAVVTLRIKKYRASLGELQRKADLP